jgi:uncharacterized membrane protein YgaE (UPF0421/DUF939 family)
MTRRDLIELGVALALVVAAAVAHYTDASPVLSFILAAIAIAVRASSSPGSETCRSSSSRCSR